MIVTTTSVSQTAQLAQKLAEKYKNGGILALIGPLGAGKTTFTQAFAKSLGIKQNLISPTFILMREYFIPGQKVKKLYHIDLYRLDKIEEIDSLGLGEIFSNPQNIVIIEWADKLGNLLPKTAVRLFFTPTAKNSREIKVED